MSEKLVRILNWAGPCLTRPLLRETSQFYVYLEHVGPITGEMTITWTDYELYSEAYDGDRIVAQVTKGQHGWKATQYVKGCPTTFPRWVVGTRDEAKALPFLHGEAR